ncbi:MAG: hypothetical protein H9Q65_03110 [Spiroplasma ixodetis]|nr:hypothetical protein [Spiroplasma ixodetis]MBP1526592.1 hypothetical protein [Spiroplasma ixodetis]MBP1528225.1 hypothetical protein [Spiroplasma ixodetis]
MEQLKILELINRWGYLNTYQIVLLLNKNYFTVDDSIRELVKKKLLKVDQLTRKNIYILSSLGNCKLGKKKKYIKINYNELVHQDLLIKWLCQQSDIISYQTERELKAENPREKGYPDLIVHYEDKEMIIELERTRKSKDRFESKLDTYYRDLQNGKEILWLVSNENMKKFINEQIQAYNWKIEQHHIEIFNDS